MNIKPSIYTSGSIEFSNDPNTWRNLMFRELHTMYDVIIPDQIKCPYVKTDREYGAWIKKHYVLPDMADVATSKYIFVLIDHAYSSGTYCELGIASWLGKDIVCYLKDGIKIEELPMFIIGCLDGAKFVSSIEEAIKYYKGLIK